MVRYRSEKEDEEWENLLDEEHAAKNPDAPPRREKPNKACCVVGRHERLDDINVALMRLGQPSSETTAQLEVRFGIGATSLKNHRINCLNQPKLPSGSGNIQRNLELAANPKAETAIQRIHLIAEMMASNQWDGHRSIRRFCEAWNVTPETVRGYITSAQAVLTQDRGSLETQRELSIARTNAIITDALLIGDLKAAVAGQRHLDEITGVNKVTPTAAVVINVVQSKEMQAILSAMGETLADYPEAKAAVEARFASELKKRGVASAPPAFQARAIDVEADPSLQ